jgi:uncharacterized membrane protein YraQ (UPF0718 family)
MDIAIARAVLALLFAVVIGLLMELIFREKTSIDDNKNTEKKEDLEDTELDTEIKERRELNAITFLKGVLAGLVVLVGILIAFLNKSNLQAIGINRSALIQTIIWGVGLALLIACFLVIKNTKTNIFLGLTYLLFTGTSQISYFSGTEEGSELAGTLEYFTSETFRIDLANMGIKAALSIIVAVVIAIFVWKKVEREESKDWMKETWLFVKKIFPYLILGVFLAGMLRVLLLPTEEFLSQWIGRNTVVANLFGVIFGVVAYFPTLMEVPIAQMFLDLGMSRGVLLAYLLADPELSIQSILVTRKFIGDKKNLVYVLLVIVFSVLAGLLFGLIVSNEPITFI